jgi:hypothetical protein
MKKNLLINPLTLKGNEILERQKQLMGISSINENKTNSAVEITKVGPDGNAYAVIRENHEWYIKKANKVNGLILEDFKYIGGLQNKKQEVYPSYAKAIKHLNLKFRSLAEAYNYDGDINVFENDNLLSDNVNSDPTKSEMLDTLRQEFGGFEGYDNFSAEEAIYWYGYNNHGGQNSNLYSALSTSKYKPSSSMSNIEDVDDEMSIAMYNTLVDNFGGEEIGNNDYELDEDVEMTEYEQAIDEMLAREELHGGQENLDVNKSGDLDAEDFKMLRLKKKV